MNTSRSHSLPHLPALDGLRGLAVLGVLLFHSNALLPGGYLGVDLFFVLSGFLITSLLLAEYAVAGRIDLRAFWIRRARRLFPALVALFPALALYAWVWAAPDELSGLRGDALAALAYVANWRAVFIEKDYWSLFAAPSPLEHTWSLAIEEQFYVLWPLLFVALASIATRHAALPAKESRLGAALEWRERTLRRLLVGVCLGLAGASVWAMWHWFDRGFVSRVYLGTDTRAGAILLGAALAALLRPGAAAPIGRIRAWDTAGVIAFAGLGYAWWRLDGQAPFLYRGGFLGTELLSLVLITCATFGAQSYCARVFSFAPFRWLGAISYGLYLWHWPIFCVVTPERFGGSWLWVHSLRAGLTLAVALLSFHYYEQPIRRRGVPWGRPWLVVSGAAAACVALIWLSTRSRPADAQLATERASDTTEPGATPRSRTQPGVFSVSFHDMPPAGELAPGTRRILVLGDSVANKLGTAMRYRQEEFGVFLAERGVGNCSIMDTPGSAGFTRGSTGSVCSATWNADVEQLKPDVTLIVLGGAFYSKVLVGDVWQATCTPEFNGAYSARLRQLVQDMGPAAGRVVLTLVPYPVGRWRHEGVTENADCLNALFRRVAADNQWPTVDLMQHVCPTPDCRLHSAGAPIRPDGLHFDGVGAEESARFTLSEVLRVTSALR